MIEKLIAWSVRNRGLVFVLTAASLIVAIWCFRSSPLDAIPDMSDTQVIISARWDRPPQILEDQVAYPIVTALLGAPKVKDIRAFSDYGYTYVYVVFDDGTDPYWARSRVLEYLAKVQGKLPEGVRPELGPDATGVGWVYEYALVDKSGKHGPSELRSLQDWQLRYALQSVRGVSEVASLGGFVRQYQITVNPTALRGYGIAVSEVVDAIREANQESGARLLELSGREYMVTVRGYLKSPQDIEAVVIRSVDNVPIHVAQVAQVTIGPDQRRGIADLDGRGDTVGGIVVMRSGENAMEVISRVKEKMATLSLPEGVAIVSTYDRSVLIEHSIETLQHKLLEEMIVVALVVILFLLHAPSAAIPIITLPIATALAFIPLYLLGLGSNIMSLGGIAIAVGAMVDASIVMVENAHKRLSQWHLDGEHESKENVLLKAVTEVGRSSFFALMVIAIAFLPIFTLEGVEGRLFRPLAYTKNFAMFAGALLSVSLVPALVMVFLRTQARAVAKPRRNASLKGIWQNLTRRWLPGVWNKMAVGTIHSEENHPISRFLFRVYGPVVHAVLKHPWRTIVIAVFAFAVSMPVFLTLGREFMPPLNEGTLLYMPTTYPGIGVAQAGELLQLQDRIIKSFPEVQSVFGKAGRADTPTDPAPFSMMETVIVLKPQDQWRSKERWYSKAVPDWLKGPFRVFWPETESYEELVADMNAALNIPGQVNSWTMPIKGRTDMLTTGVRTSVGIKLYGEDLAEIDRLGKLVEAATKTVPGTRSVYAERTTGGSFIDYTLKRDELSRFGLSVDAVEAAISTAVGGETIGQTIEGRARYPIQVRYPRELRDSLESIGQVLLTTSSGAQIPVSQVATLSISEGPGMIRDENGHLAGYVFVDVANRDLGSYVDELKATITSKVVFPPGYYPVYSGQYEFMERVKERMAWILPLTLFIIFLLVRANTRSTAKTFIVLLAVPFSLVGVVWILALLGYNVSIGVWAGIIAVLGVDAETGIFMLMYLDLSYEDHKARGLLRNDQDLRNAVSEGAVKRIRPKLMTVLAAFVGLLPIMWSSSFEAGADMMKRIAAPMVGGIVTSFLVELLLYPAIYYLWKSRTHLPR